MSTTQVLLVLAALSMSAPANYQPVETPDCVRTCTPDLLVQPDHNSVWLVAPGVAVSGQAQEFCQKCKPCTQNVLVSYAGIDYWQVTKGDLNVGGHGPGFASLRLETDCDGSDLGTLSGHTAFGGPTSTLTAQLYCTCEF